MLPESEGGRIPHNLTNGGFGRSTPKPLRRRQYSGTGCPFPGDLRMNSAWMYTAVVELPPRITPASIGPSTGARPDAQCDVHIAVRFKYSNTHTISFRLLHWFFQLSETKGKRQNPENLYGWPARYRFLQAA